MTLRTQRIGVSAVFVVHGAVMGTFSTRIPAIAEHLHLTPGTLGVALFAPAVGSHRDDAVHRPADPPAGRPARDPRAARSVVRGARAARDRALAGAAVGLAVRLRRQRGHGRYRDERTGRRPRRGDGQVDHVGPARDVERRWVRRGGRRCARRARQRRRTRPLRRGRDRAVRAGPVRLPTAARHDGGPARVGAGRDRCRRSGHGPGRRRSPRWWSARCWSARCWARRGEVAAVRVPVRSRAGHRARRVLRGLRRGGRLRLVRRLPAAGARRRACHARPLATRSSPSRWRPAG